MKRVTAAFVMVYLCLFSLTSYANIKVVSPVPGVWANRQVLSIETDGGGEVFYSLDGNDPVLSGFAYDAPVLLDKDGDVTLRVVSLSNDGEMQDTYTIYYTVQRQSSKIAFLNAVAQTGIVDYTSGTTLSIPSTVRYSIDGGAFEKGKDIMCSADNILTRTVQMTVIDEEDRHYGFVLRVLNDSSEAYQETAVPFSVSGWYNLWLDNAKCIYSIDGGMWRVYTGAGDAIVLNRRMRHTISWQSVAYKKGNPISTFVLPPIPYLESGTGETGEVVISIDGEDGYKIGTVSGGRLRLMDSAVLDVLQGDEGEGFFPVRMYYKGVYQGTISMPYSIGRKRPNMPVITSSVLNKNIARRDVDVTVTAKAGDLLFVAVDGGEYKEIEGAGQDGYKVHLTSSAVEEHTVSAYCVDSKGNISDTNQYALVIDKYNYFVDEEKGRSNALGTADDPLSNLDECLTALIGGAHITLRGTVHTKGAVFKDCTLQGEGTDARVIIEDGGVLLVQGKVALKDIIIEREGKVDNIPLLDAQDAILSLSGVEAFATYAKNGFVIKTKGGQLDIQNSGITGTAAVFVAAVATDNTDVNIQSSRISSNAMEAVAVTSHGGQIAINANAIRINAQRAHALELFNNHVRITDNTLDAQLSSIGDKAIYAHDSVVEESNNTERGW